MATIRARLAGIALSASLASAAAAGPSVTFHFMQIEQVVGGVSGDTGAQAVQLRMRSFAQNFVSEGRLVAWDAQGLNPVVLIDMETDVPNGALGDRVLIATAGFAAHTSPGAEPDFIMDNPIPASYLAAGRLTFENDAGNDIVWSLAWGGAAYTGPHNGSIFNDDNGNYGPAWDGPLPTSGLQALQFQGTASAQSKSNATDYKLTAGAAVFTNNAKKAFTLVAPCYPDCDGDDVLSIDDFVCFQTFFAFGDDYADCDGDNVLSIDDFVCFQTFFAFGCP